jgi:hypothetical protein
MMAHSDDACLTRFLQSLAALNPESYVDRRVSQDGFHSHETMADYVAAYPGAVPALKGLAQLQLDDLAPHSEVRKSAILTNVHNYDVEVPVCAYIGVSYARVLAEMRKAENWKAAAAPVSLGVIAGSSDQRALSESQTAALGHLTGVPCDAPLFFYRGKDGAPESSARAWHIDMTATVYTLTFSDTAGCTAYLALPRFECASLLALSRPLLPLTASVVLGHLEVVVDAVIVSVLNAIENAEWIDQQTHQTQPNTVYKGLPNTYYHRSPRTASERCHVVVVS